MKTMKSIGLWIVVVFLALMVLGAAPSFASILGVILIVLIVPINRIQSFFKKYITGKAKIITLIVLAILMFATLPDATTPTTFDNSMLPTELPTEAPTELPTEAPTEAPAEKPTEVPTEPPHTHSFSEATCTAPKTCACGAIEGKAKGHNWKEATCTEPKCCTVCGITSGLTAGHKFVNGKCTMCGKQDPDYVKETMVWIPTNGGKKYHSNSWCSNMVNPKQVTQSKAESLGYTPCKKCH